MFGPVALSHPAHIIFKFYFFLQIKNHQKTIDQLKSDLQMSRTSQSDESERFTAEIKRLKEDLQLTNGELEEAGQQNAQFRMQMDMATDELEKAKLMHEKAVNEVGLQ